MAHSATSSLRVQFRSAVGERIFEIRRSLSPNKRRLLSLRDFAALLSAAPAAEGRKFDPTSLCRWENGQSSPSFHDIAVIASVDPEQRGRLWLIYGDESETAERHPESVAGAA